MGGYILKRLGLALAVALAVSMIAFLLLRLSGDPAIAIAGEGARAEDIERTDPRLKAAAATPVVGRRQAAVLKATLSTGATGKVVFTSGGRTLCTATITAGRATCTTSRTLRPGAWAVRARYAGDASYLADTADFAFRKRR